MALPNIFSAAETHLLERIAETPAATDPFDHCVVDGCLTWPLFDAIHEHWPSDDVMMSLTDTGRATYDARMVMLTEARFFDKLPDASRAFWIDVTRLLIGAPLVNAALSKFSHITVPRFEALATGPQVEPEMLVVSDRTRYEIGPHTDTATRLVSLLLYLPQDESTRSFGTSLYRPKEAGFTSDGQDHYPREMFDRVKTVDFIPNRLVLFPRTKWSFHGVEPIAAPVVDRRLIIINIRVPKAANLTLHHLRASHESQ